MNRNRNQALDLEALTEAAECLKTLAHPHRLQIVQMLLSRKRYSVNEIAAECNLAQPTTSDHLRLMQRCGFLTRVKKGAPFTTRSPSRTWRTSWGASSLDSVNASNSPSCF